MAAEVTAIILRTYLAGIQVEHLAPTLKKGGIKDLSLFFPPNKREDKFIDKFFRERQLAPVADWWLKKKSAMLKEGVVKTIKEHRGNEDSNADVCSWD